MMFAPLARALQARGVRYVMIGVSGANCWAHSAGVVFSTMDRDLFLPPDPMNLLSAWQACEACGLQLWSGNEPLDSPRDEWLAQRVVGQRALTRAADGQDLAVDLTFVMAQFEFEEVWENRRHFRIEGVEIPVARLSHIVQSKAATGRDKDQWFLATHAEEIRRLLSSDEG